MAHPRSASPHHPACLETLEPRLLLDAAPLATLPEAGDETPTVHAPLNAGAEAPLDVGDLLVGEGDYYRVWFTAPVTVGSGVEDLLSTTLMVRNISGDSVYNPTVATDSDGSGVVLSGNLHQEQFPGPVPPNDPVPSPDLQSSGGSAIDTHWLVHPNDVLLSVVSLSEDVVTGSSSDEPGALGGITGFANTLKGAFALDLAAPPATWSVAQVVVPAGSEVTLSVQFAASGVADTFEGSHIIGVAELEVSDTAIPSPAKFLPGDSVTLSGTILNSGSADAPSSTAELRLSKNTTWGDADDIVVTSYTGSLGEGATVDLPTGSIPWDAAGGTYYVGIRADTGGAVYELDKVNNTWWSGSKVVTLISPGSAFDEDFYLDKYPDIAQHIPGVFTNAFEHFMRFGQTEGRQPNAFYDEAYYLEHNAPVAAAVSAGTFDSGFDHFIRYGQNEARDISPYFSQKFYLQHNQDVKAAVQAGIFSSAFDHFLNYGQTEARKFHWLFDRAYYRSMYTDVVNAVNAGIFRSVFQHFVLYGRLEGRRPSDYFRPGYYLSVNPDVGNAVQAGVFETGFDHYILYGAPERRRSTPEFSESYYLNHYTDVKNAVQAGVFINGLHHYILAGRAEGRLPLPPD